MRLGFRLTAALAILLSMYFAVRSAVAGWSFARPIPVWDQWEFVRDYLLYLDGQYGIENLFSQHNEHRIVTTRLVLFADAMLTDMSGLIGIGVTYLSLLLVAGLLSLLAVGRRRGFVAITMGTVLLLGIAWGTSQSENLGSAFQVQFPLVHLFALITLIVAARVLIVQRRPAVVALLAIGCAADFLTVFSLASGMLLLASLLAIPFLLRRWRPAYLGLIVFHCAGTALYFWRFEWPPTSHENVLTLVGFTTAYIGHGFGSLDSSGLCGSVLLVVFFVVLVWQLARSLRMLDPAETNVAILLCLCLFVFVEAAATAYGRAFAGIGNAFASRYCTASLVFGATLLACLWRFTSTDSHRSILMRVVLIVIASVMVYRANPSWQTSVWRDSVLRADRAAFASVVGLFPLEVMNVLHWHPESIWEPMTRMRQLRLGHFAETAHFYQPPLNLIDGIAGSPLSPCRSSIDKISGDRNDHLELVGWAAEPNDAVQPTWIVAYDANGAIIGMTRAGWPRSDVAAYLQARHDLFGFDFLINTTNRGNAALPVRLIVVLDHNRAGSPNLCVIEKLLFANQAPTPAETQQTDRSPAVTDNTPAPVPALAREVETPKESSSRMPAVAPITLQLIPEMVSIPGSTFAMGSDDDLSEKPIHRVAVRSFAISKFPITNREWKACVAAKGCTYVTTGKDDAPVATVSWTDAQQYVDWLSKVTQKTLRLPSEAEWEYAARGGTRTKYWWGDQLQADKANCNGCNEPYDASQPLKVGSFKPNPFGLYDMGGNIHQWAADCWHKNYQGAPSDGSRWGDNACYTHVIRSGSWKNDPSYVRPSHRDHYDTEVRYPTHGFRVAHSL
jgi:formylglycine-generating enzyme required for sulfatase activity